MTTESEGMDMQVDLGRRIRAARYLSGKRVLELGEELGWSSEKLYRLEQGRQVPDALELAAIARATSQPIDFFLGITPEVEEAPIFPPPVPLVNEGGSS